MTPILSLPPIPGPTTPPSTHRRAASTSSAHPKRPLSSAKTVLSVEVFKRKHAAEYAHLHPDADPKTLAAEAERLEEERRLGREKRESLQKGLQDENQPPRPAQRPLSLVQSRSHARATSTSTLVHARRASRPASSLLPLGQTLEVLLEDASPVTAARPLPATSSPASQSTYSWASSFSGETAELRMAAQYVPTETDLTSDGTVTESEILNSPAARDIRRKRIVAIAHTVRQLEGIGSRELEDPAFFDVLSKAWYARFDTPKGVDTDAMHSPPDPEFRTPHLDEDPSPRLEAESRSRSVRYSYASTLHDLALDGGAAQGSRLMSEKAWLRPSSYVGTPWGQDFAPSSRPVTPDAASLSSHDHYLDSPFSLEPVRGLRRENRAIDPTPTGLGFAGPWWDASRQPTESADFQDGEDDSIPSRLLVPLSTPTTEPSTPFVVLDPVNVTSAQASDMLYPPPLRPSSPSTALSVSNASPSSSPSRPNFTKTPSNTSSRRLSVSDASQPLDGSIGLAISSPPLTPERAMTVSTSEKISRSVVYAGTSRLPAERVMNPAAQTLDPPQNVQISASSSYRDSWRGTASSPAEQIANEANLSQDAGIAKSPPSRLTSPQTLFFVGFLLPLTWFIAGWITCDNAPSDVEKEPGAGVASTISIHRSTSPRHRWAQHDNIWVSRCRLAAAISIPVLVIWALIAIILIAVLR
ncbi:hypothetical protein BD324DRAFT_606826 [Kockovaella imperatae]|uniref:Uncharacterized protein n=1 Tax=Kockovaella imperatae TaxID=4999 RepID=A0A1Y1UT58_9TREE|nr:hypothetical protein BD324DRAFT_606826 [Kockovaella imperatae]ORX41198.1 hypothetical protein BD324DRAFT_606826 [Kockovaella imperatae]